MLVTNLSILILHCNNIGDGEDIAPDVDIVHQNIVKVTGFFVTEESVWHPHLLWVRQSKVVKSTFKKELYNSGHSYVNAHNLVIFIYLIGNP